MPLLLEEDKQPAGLVAQVGRSDALLGCLSSPPGGPQATGAHHFRAGDGAAGPAKAIGPQDEQASTDCRCCFHCVTLFFLCPATRVSGAALGVTLGAVLGSLFRRLFAGKAAFNTEAIADASAHRLTAGAYSGGLGPGSQPAGQLGAAGAVLGRECLRLAGG
jgi:hypothetical protein